jgi:hypothetical protein
MKRLLFLLLILSSVAQAQTPVQARDSTWLFYGGVSVDSGLSAGTHVRSLRLMGDSLFTQDGRFVGIFTSDSVLKINKRILQRYDANPDDTLATLREVRLYGGGGTDSSGVVGDTLTIKAIRTNTSPTSKRIVFQYLVPARTDTMLQRSATTYSTPRLPLMNSWEGLLTAPNYTIPASHAADTFSIGVFINGSRLLQATPYDLNDWAVEFQLYVRNMYYGDSSWYTVSEWYGSNQTGGYPPYYSYDTTVMTQSSQGGWGFLNLTTQSYDFWRNGWPGYRPTWYVFGVMPGGQVKYRFRTYYNGKTTVSDAYPRLTPILLSDGITQATWMIYSKVPIYTPDHWVTSAQMDSTAWIFWGNVLAWENFEVLQSLKAQSGRFQNGITVGAVPDTSSGVWHLAPQDTTVGSVTMVTDSAKIITLQPGGHKAGTFLLPEVEHDGVADTLLSQKDRLRALPYSSTLIKYIQADTNIAFIVSGDTLKVRSTTGAGSSAASFYTVPAEKPPTSPSSFNDEFDTYNGSKPDTNSKWKFLGTKAQSLLQLDYGITSGRYWFADTSKGGTTNLAHLLGQKITDTAFSIVTKVNLDFEGGLAGFMGLFVYDSTSTRGIMLRMHSSDATFLGQYQTVAQFTSQTSIGTELISTGSTGQRAVPLLSYLKIEKTTGKALNFYRSQDGIIWQLWYSTTSTAYIESAGRIDWIGIVTGNYQGSTWTTVGTFNWFRYGWVADFDPTLYR